MYCNRCGQQIVDPQAKFCPKCGAGLTAVNINAAFTAVNTNAAVGDKSKLAAGLLGVFLGGWGIHRFYLGYVGIGIIQIIVTLITFGFGALWGFIEGILILTGTFNKDAKGLLIKSD